MSIGRARRGRRPARTFAVRFLEEYGARVGVEQLLAPAPPIRPRIGSSSRSPPTSRPSSASAAISLARRRVSWYRRAFWIATPTFAAIVDSSRASASPKRPACSMLCTLITPIASVPEMIGTPRYDLAGVPTTGDPELLERLRPVEQQRHPGLQDPGREALAEAHRRVLAALPALAVVGEVDHVGRGVVEGDVDEVGAEHLPELVAEPLDQGVELELLGERLPDVVDDRELGRALPRLLEQPGVLERDAQAPGERREQADVGLAERVFAIEVVERDHAGPSVPDQQGHEDRRLRGLARRSRAGCPPRCIAAPCPR